MKKKRLILGLIIIMCLLFSSSNISFAGNGDGSGGNSGEPLTLSASSILNGQKDVPLKPQIKLTFSKNVVNMSVKDVNQKCFSLQTSKGKSVSLQIIMADDQIEVEKRNDIIVVPAQNLLPGTNYILKVSPELQSKSGVKLGQEIQLSFQTFGATPTIAKNTPTVEIDKSIPKPVVKNKESNNKSVEHKRDSNIDLEKKDIVTVNSLESKSTKMLNTLQDKDAGLKTTTVKKASLQAKPSNANKTSAFKISKVGKVLIPIVSIIILFSLVIYVKYKKIL